MTKSAHAPAWIANRPSPVGALGFPDRRAADLTGAQTGAHGLSEQESSCKEITSS
jgi:hypothetical protein